LAGARKGFVGIDLGGTNLRAGLVDPQGNIVRRARDLTQASRGRDHVISRIVELAEELSAGVDLPVGIASPGPVDSKTGVLLNPPNLPGWGRVDMKKELEDRLKRKVYVQNDANMVAYGEFRFGAGRGANSMLCLTVGTGIGSGLVLDGRLHLGDHGFAAEIGHTVIDPDGPLCGCGAKGCLESYAAAKPIVSQTLRLIKAGQETILRGEEGDLTVEKISHAAGAGDGLARGVLLDAGRYLGIAISNALALVDVALVVVGGGVSGAGELILKPIRETVAEILLDHDLRGVEIRPSELGDDAGILGIFAYVTSDL
jgi:glucokinase